MISKERIKGRRSLPGKRFMEKENRNALFETTPVPKAFLTLALPVVMSKIISMIYNMVDIYFIGRTGNANLVAGVSICAPVFY